MSNYTQSTNFATKDALPSGDPLKIVKGTEINTEFANIAIAVATKADLASPALTGTPTAPTASAGTNTTQIATTAYSDAAVTAAITAAKSALYPVGSIYTATVSTNPGTLLGFGTWTAFGAGRVLIGNGGGFSAGATGGSADAIVVSHTHTNSVSTAADHVHPSGVRVEALDATYGTAYVATAGEYLDHLTGSTTNSTNTLPAGSHTHTVTINSAGSSGTNGNLQPYIVVYMWNRTA